MSSTLKVDILQDSGGNNIISSDGSGDLTIPTGKLSGHNYPAFEAYLSANQTGITDNTATKVQFDTEAFDTDNCYDNSTNYRFTPTVAGKYFVYASVAGDANASSNLTHMNLYLYKNGSSYKQIEQDFRNNYAFRITAQANAIIDMNGTTDYLEIYGVIDFNSGSGDFNQNTKNTYFGAYRIGD